MAALSITPSAIREYLGWGGNKYQRAKTSRRHV